MVLLGTTFQRKGKNSVVTKEVTYELVQRLCIYVCKMLKLLKVDTESLCNIKTSTSIICVGTTTTGG